MIHKVKLLLEEEFCVNQGITACLNALCAIVRVGIDDKLSQLMFSAIPLLEDILDLIKK